MPNRAINLTQVPVEAKDLYFEVYAHVNDQGVYQEHRVRLLYQPHDDTGAAIGQKRDVSPLPLSGAQQTALANFVANILAVANAREGT